MIQSQFITFLIIVVIAAVFFLVYGILKSREKADPDLHAQLPTPDTDKAETTQICPFCKSEIPVDATACRFCGRDVSRQLIAGKAIFNLGQLMLWVGLIILLILGIPIYLYLR